MRKLLQGRLSVFKFEGFRKYRDIAHFITTKEGWVSGERPRFTGDHDADYTPFRHELAVSCMELPDRFIFARQTHSDHVTIVNSKKSPATIADTDALITNEPGLFVCVQTADCVPILLYDPEKKVVAAIHAGWRGTVSRIAGKTVGQMVQNFGCKPRDIVAGIGPSIHLHAFEVGSDVIEAVKDHYSNAVSLLKPSLVEGKAYFDLWEANKTALLETGLLPENIDVIGLCSYEQSDLFFSARRDGDDTGRMVSGIRLLD